MGEYDSPARHLPFPLNESSLIQRTTEDDVDCTSPSSFVWPEDADEKTLVPFYLSLNEYTVLSSSVDAGSDIAYSDDAIRVWWLWTRNMRCTVAICEWIIDCVNTDADTRNTIINMLLADQGFNDALAQALIRGTPVSTTGITTPLVDNCDEDVLFGSVTYIINSMNTINEDLFEIMEAATNEEERMARFFAAIPIFETLPVDEIIDGAQQLLEDFQENYSAQWTDEYRDELRCGLFCQALDEDNCTITLDSLWRFFGERVGTSVSIEGLAGDAIEFILTGSWGGSQIVDIMMYFQIVA